MEILKVNYEIGKKCFTRFNNAFHECIFLGTESVENGKGSWVACYVLNIAGVGVTYVAFDRFGQFDDWYRGTNCKTTLYRTLEDCQYKRNAITAQYGSTDNCYNKSFMQPFFDFCSVCCCGGTLYTYVWNGTDAVVAIGYFSTGKWKIDENGFECNATLRALEQRDNWRCSFPNGTKCYGTKAECLADNKPKVVTF